MADFQSVLDQALNPENSTTVDETQMVPNPASDVNNGIVLPNVPLSSVLPQTNVQKQVEVDQASKQIKTTLPTADPSSLNYYELSGEQALGKIRPNASQIERDLLTLTPSEFHDKYGELGQEIRTRYAQEGNTYFLDRYTPRTIPGKISDFVKGAVGLTGSSALGLTGALVGLVAPETGAETANWGNKINDFTQENETSVLREHRRANTVRQTISHEENTLLYDRDLANGDSSFVAGLKNFGREFISGIKDAASDPELLAQSVADNTGSLLINYALTSGIGALASKLAPAVRMGEEALTVEKAAQTVAAAKTAAPITREIAALESSLTQRAIFDKAVEKGTPMLATGLQEGAGTYQQAVQDVLQRSHEDLQRTSQIYRDTYDQYRRDGLSADAAEQSARYHLAGLVARQAEKWQAPLAAATALISHVAEHPFRFSGAGKFVKDIAKEGIEEGLQNLTDQLSRNIATKDKVDTTQDLSQGLGEQAGQGALFGMASAGAMGGVHAAPVLAVKSTIGGAKLAGRGTMAVLNHVFGGSTEQVKTQAAKASPVSGDNLSLAANTVINNAPTDTATMQTDMDTTKVDPKIRLSVDEFVNGFHNILKYDLAGENLATDVPVHLQPVVTVVADAENRPQAIAKLAQSIAEEKDPQQALIKASYLHGLMEEMAPYRHLPQEVIDSLDLQSKTARMLRRYEQLASGVESMPEVQAANKLLGLHFEQRDASQITPVTEQELGTPEGQTKVNDALLNAKLSPNTGSVKAIDQILEHAENGRINLTQSQRNALNGSRILLEAQEKYAESKKAAGLTGSEKVSQQLFLDSQTDEGKISAREFFIRIRDAVNSGDLEAAKAELADMGKLVLHMRNKVQAINAHVEGNNPHAEKLPYMALAPRTESTGKAGVRRWYNSLDNPKRSDGGFVNTRSADSIEVVRNIGRDHETLANIYNGLVDAFPQLGESKIAPVALHPAVTGDTVANVYQGFKNGTRKVTDFSSQYQAQRATEQQQQAAHDKQAPAESIVSKNAIEANKPVTVQPSFTTKSVAGYTDEQLHKWLEKYAEKVARGEEPTPLQKANFEVIDAEMTRREDAAVVQQKAEEAKARQENVAATPAQQAVEVPAASQPVEIAPTPEPVVEAAPVATETTPTTVPTIIELRPEVIEKGSNPVGDHQLGAYDQNGNKIGQISLIDDGKGNLEVSWAGINEDLQRKGLGTQMYQQAIEYARKIGAKSIYGDMLQFDGAKGVWQKLESQYNVDRSGLTPRINFEPENKTGSVMEYLYPKLAKTIRNMFVTAFKPRGKGEIAPTRTFDSESPATDIREALTSERNFRYHLGDAAEKIKYTLTSEIAAAYQKLLAAPPEDSNDLTDYANLGGIMKVMQDRLQAFLKDSYSSKDPRTMLEFWQNGHTSPTGKTVNQMAAGKALNIAEDENGVQSYNKNLLEHAVMAGLHWFLTAGHGHPSFDDDKLEKITGIPANEISEDNKRILRTSYSLQDVTQGVSNTILQFWGVSKLRDADKTYAEGIVESVAKEVLKGMETVGFFQVSPVKLIVGIDPKTGKEIPHTHIRFVPANVRESAQFKDMFEQLFSYPHALADAVLVKPEPVNYLGDEVPEAPRTQMNSDTRNTRQQLSAISNANKIEYRANVPLMNLYQYLGGDFLKDVFGGGHNLKDELFNAADKKVREGQSLTVGAAFNRMMDLIQEIQNRSMVTGESLRDTIIRYAHNMSKVGRLQQLGSYSPQASKLMREVILPTWATLDLVNNAKHRVAMNLAIAQALGIKVEKVSPQVAALQAQELIHGPMAPVIKMLGDWMAEHGNKDEAAIGTNQFREELQQALQEATKDFKLKDGTEVSPALSFNALHALLEVARFNNSTAEEKAAFRTGLYVEADGKTNGPINAMVMLGNGIFKPNWIQNTRKGGLHIGLDGKAMYQLDQVDLYKTAAAQTQSNVRNLTEILKASPQAEDIMPIHQSMMNLMNMFLSGVEYSNGKITIERGIAKNPLTITIYGSSKAGIAGNLANAMLENLYARLSKAAQFQAEHPEIKEISQAIFQNDPDHAAKYKQLLHNMNTVFSGEIKYHYGQKEYYVNTEKLGHKAITEIPPITYEITPANFKVLQTNMQQLLIQPLHEAIESTVGKDVMDASKLMQTSTNKQSIIYSAYIDSLIKKALADRALNDPTYHPGDFLSQKQLDDIVDQAAPLSPLAENSGLRVMITKAIRYTEKSLEYSRTLDDKWGTSPDLNLPGAAGVSGMPFMIISHGDGYMIQAFLNSEHKGQGTLPVFDGIHMPLDRINELSQSANEMAWQAWMNNPAESVRGAYFKMLKNSKLIHSILAEQYEQAKVDGDNFKKADYEKMTLAAALLASMNYGKKSIQNFASHAEMADYIFDQLTREGGQLRSLTASIDARHEVMRQVSMWADQMASAASPYHNGAQLAIDMSSPEATARDLNKLYQPIYDKNVDDLKKYPGVEVPMTHEEFLKQQKIDEFTKTLLQELNKNLDLATEAKPDLTDNGIAREVEQSEPENAIYDFSPAQVPPVNPAMHELTQTVGRGNKATGVRILVQSSIKKLASKLNLSENQREVLSQLFRAGGIGDYKVITGTLEQIQNYVDKVGSATLQDMKGKDGKLNGFISIGEKAIYLINPSPETFTHELIHAATYEAILAHYSNQEGMKPEIREAVQRLEELMNQFMAARLDVPVESLLNTDIFNVPTELQIALANARTAIDSARNDMKTSMVVRKAKALNEFMAWTLSNKQLADRLKVVPANKFVVLAKNVIQALKNLFWGTARASQVKDNMFSNILFNTGIVMRDAPTISQIFSDATMQHFEVDHDSRIADIRNSLNFYVNQYLDNFNLTEREHAYLESLPARTKEEKAFKAAEKAKFLVTNRTIAENKLAHEVVRINAEVADSFRTSFRLSPSETTAFNEISAALAVHSTIDPMFLNRAQELYLQVKDSITPESFMDPSIKEGTFEHDREFFYAQNKYNTIIGREGLSYNHRKQSSILPTFIALAVIDGNFRDVLAKISKPIAEKSKATGVDAALENFFNKTMLAISSWISGDVHSKNILDSIDALAQHVNELAQDEQQYLEAGADKVNGVVDRVNQEVVQAMQDISDKGVALSKKWESNPNASNFAKKAAKVVGLLSGALSDKNSNTAAESIISFMNQSPVRESIRELVVDLVGRIDSSADIYDMIKQTKAAVDQVRQNYRKAVPQILERKFKQALQDTDKQHVFHGLGKSDLASLMEGHSASESLRFLINDTERATKIAALEEQVRKADPKNWDLYKRKMQELARYMMTEETSTNQLKNAYAVSLLLGEDVKNKVVLNDKTIQAIDHLTTLYAVERLTADRKAALVSLVQNEAAGMEFMMEYLHSQRKGELEKVSQDELLRLNHHKGYIPSTPDTGVELIIGKDSDLGDLRVQGFHRVSTYTGSDIDFERESRSYYFRPFNGRTAFAQGIMQNVDPTASGINQVTGFSTGQTAGRITDETQVERLAKRMKYEKVNTEHLMPLYNEAHQIYAFERAMDPKLLAMRNPSEDITKMIGVWRGRQIEEELSRQVNHALIDRAHQMYTSNAPINQAHAGEYVNLFDSSQLDKIQQEAVRLFTDDTKRYAESVFGKGKFMVRRDLLNDMIGYRHASIGDMWTGNTRWSEPVQRTVRDVLTSLFGIDAYKNLVRLEQVNEGFMADMRRNIVIKSMVVPTMNMISNIYQLVSRGVPLSSIVKGTPAKLHEIHVYNKFRLREIELEAELRAASNDPNKAGKLEAELQSIKDSYQRMSIAPLLNNGEFSTIAGIGDSAEDLELSSGRVTEWLEKQTDKLPPGLKTAAKYGMIARDTALFQGLERLAQYGDFIAKAILYDDMTQRLKYSSKEALAHVTDEYINYDRPVGRSRSYLNNNGLIWFYHYKIRIAKVALNMFRNNPVHALIAMNIPAFSGVGNVFKDNIFAKLFTGHLKYSLGPMMSPRGVNVGPWSL